MLVVDDALLLGILAESDEPAITALASGAVAGEVFTTGCWYWRLARAIGQGGGGSLSRQFGLLDDESRARVSSALTELPRGIGLLALRRLVPVMTALGANLNLLTAEALAAALVLRADIAVTTFSPLLARAGARVGVGVRVIPVD